MSKLHDKFVKNLSDYPKKKFFFELSKEFNSKQLLNKIKIKKNFLKKNKIKSFGIQGKNSLEWLLWYVAADKLCKKVYIFSLDFDNSLLNKLQKINNIDLIVLKNKKKFFKNSFIKNYKRQDILFTSGTTKIPKGVIISEKSYLHVAKSINTLFKQNFNDLELLSMPFNHSFGLVRLRCCLLSGSSFLITDGLKEFPKIYDFSQQNRITGISLVPAGVSIIKFLLRNNVHKFVKNLKFFEIGSDFLSYDLRYWLKKYFLNTLIYHHYGSTEASRSFIIPRGKNDNLKLKSNFLGRPLKGCKFKILIKDNKGIGELLVKGKNLFDQYLDNIEINQKFLNGWFKTGDLVKKNKNHLSLIGRVDNLINIGGFKLYPENIEKFLDKIAGIEKSLCYKIKDKFGLERISISIETKVRNRENLKNKIFKEFSKLPNYSYPSIINFKKIALTKSGKKVRPNKS